MWQGSYRVKLAPHESQTASNRVRCDDGVWSLSVMGRPCQMPGGWMRRKVEDLKLRDADVRLNAGSKAEWHDNNVRAVYK